MQIQKKRKYTPRINAGGNYCGHNPDAPAFREVINRCAEQASHPLIRTAIKKLSKYFNHPSVFCKLGEICSNGDRRKRRKDGSPRAVRSEQRDINIMVMAYCLSKINLIKLQVGVIPYHDSEELFSPTEQEIADAIGQNVERVRSALAHWKHAGYLSITQRRRRNDVTGDWESKSPIICIKDTVFLLMGIPRKWLQLSREYQSKKWKEQRQKRFKAAVDRAAERERDLAYAKAKEAKDFFVKDLMPLLNQLPAKQKSWQQRTHHGPPTR